MSTALRQHCRTVHGLAISMVHGQLRKTRVHLTTLSKCQII